MSLMATASYPQYLNKDARNYSKSLGDTFSGLLPLPNLYHIDIAI